ncbi:hypothetical protein KIW84_065289 [Lathyrus oleraceus]|uniref:Uncharacterized protein n=1 Tax=Pisum sativum TaxID=3888 RepID=A0A9D5AA68_PEA|nr:hypothetical protein KIW84_065289 [Pisum sativum]
MEMEDYEGKNALWSGILRFRYINPELKMFTDDGRMTRRGDSIWAIDKEGNIDDAGSWDRGDWIWKFLSNSDGSINDASIDMDEVYMLLDDFEPLQDEEDEYCWMAEKSECFTVKSCYSKMAPCLTDLYSDLLAALSTIWKMKVPLKIQIFW